APAAARDTARAQHETRAAHDLTSDAVWHLAAHLPVIGSSLHTTGGLAAVADDVTHAALPPLVGVASDVAHGHLRDARGTIDLARVEQAHTALTIAGPHLRAAAAVVAGLPAKPFLSVVGSARTELRREILTLDAQVVNAELVTRVAPAMLGAGGLRRYLVVLQNPAEARGTGGLAGTYAVLTADHGHLHLESVGSDDDIVSHPDTPVPGLPADFTDRWGAFSAGGYWTSANLTPHFPYAAQVWEGLWDEQHPGRPVDGIIATDPVEAGAILGATGPVTLPDGTVLHGGPDGGDVPAYVESALYARYGTPEQQPERKAQLEALVKAAYGRITDASVDARAVLEALGVGATQGRVLVASTHAEEQDLAPTVVGGELPDARGPFAYLSVSNAGGNKMDYYLDRSLSYTADGCGGATRSSTISVTLHNSADADGLSVYVAGRNDAFVDGVAPGMDRVYLTIYAAVGATLQSATLDGRPAGITQGTERGHLALSAYLDIPPGADHTLTVSLVEPTDGTFVLLPPQPLPRPERVETQVQRCLAEPFLRPSGSPVP
ncbi:MAG TPA: DUF4012 domain-containing protein, partial [Mycobacteriales bacterium]|nr:DUF4012 domain-containing protein [Mycobacteriales bacterium]